ncbi:hypothetical protein BOTNAR_0186g00100 [Botryotinia narcissicola]|uniref:Uncharacterized protein n=1 Tax=Botryotinia narcissicola TaxID=278944 RepID=A0A4Z1I9B6_9HELO|nr:hypothetical protein BOTNAR_0186g00100 [Botryotinia narcissicola]
MYVITTTNNPEAASCHPTLTKPELVSLAMTQPDDRIRDAAKRNGIIRYHLFGDPPGAKTCDGRNVMKHYILEMK